MKGDQLVQEVLYEWEDLINRVEKTVVGEKMTVCGKSVRWWDNEIHSCKAYKKGASGKKEL